MLQVVKPFKTLCFALFIAISPFYMFAQTPPAPINMVVHSGFINLMQDPKSLIFHDLYELPPSIKRVALYNSNDKLSKTLSKQTKTMIEGQILAELLNTKRFAVTACVECNQINVILNEEQVKIEKAIESNQQLRKLAKTIAVDAFFVWSAQVIENRYRIDMRLIRAQDNQVLWTHQYAKKTTEEDVAKDFKTTQWEVYLSSIGFKLERTSDTLPTLNISQVTVFGFRRREASTFYPHLNYGLGIEIFANVTSREAIPFMGGSVTGRLSLDFPALQKYIPTSTYIEVAQSLYNQHQALIFKYGLEFPFAKNGIISLGVLYTPENTITWNALDDYTTQSTFGGATYEIMLGYRL
ncbi:MAG: hypothetical protein HRU38_13180 [Saccharospirillaceae bacterium]|nr:hypothetical protein [Pseudomonadales bacterium]NRB79597.1 hypothetical protein [Saccharospirillaceae bacterium]